MSFLPRCKTPRLNKLSPIAIFLALIVVGYSVFNTPAVLRAMELGVTAQVNQEYDDNVTFSHNNEITDFLTNLTLGLNALYEGRTRTIQAQAHVTQQLFFDHNEFSNTSQDLILDINQEMGKNSQIRIHDTLEHSEQPNTFEDAFGRQSGRYGYYKNRLNLTHSSSLSKQLQLLLKYTNETNQFDRKDILDSFVNGAGFETNYAFDSATGGVFRYNFAMRQFQNGPDALTHTISPGIKRSLTKQLLLEVYSGADFIHSYDNSDFIRPLYGLTLSNELSEKTTIGMSFLKQYQATSFNSSELFDQWRVSGFWRKELSARLNAEVNSFYGEGKYTQPKITDKLTGAGISLNYQLSSRTQVTAAYNFSQTASNDETRSYVKNLIFLGLKIDF